MKRLHVWDGWDERGQAVYDEIDKRQREEMNRYEKRRNWLISDEERQWGNDEDKRRLEEYLKIKREERW